MFFAFDREFYRFQRNLKDMYPYEIIYQDDQAVIVHNVVGLNKEDIEIAIKRDGYGDYLVITGEKKNQTTNKTYRIDSRFRINIKEIDEAGIEWNVEDGLLYIYITYKRLQQPEIKIKYKG